MSSGVGMTESRDVSIRVPVLARVEGEGALHIDVRQGRIEDLKFKIFEPPRLFEKFLEGRSVHELPDTVARICGICPVAYQMSAVHAIEQIFGCDPGSWVRRMRRLIYCGEWLESHALHVHLLALPDYFGCASVVELAKLQPEAARRGLRLQGIGNKLIRMLGGRSVHPVGVRIGGFYKAPDDAQVEVVLRDVRELIPQATDLVHWLAEINLAARAPAQSFTSVALRHADEYPLNEGRLVSDRGLDIAISEFDRHFVEHQVPHSTALHCLLHDEPYLVGPLARLNLNHDRLPASVLSQITGVPLALPSTNMFDSALARAVEMLFCLHEAESILCNYQRPDRPYVDYQVQPGVGYGCSEAPRGTLWHRYEVDADGRVLSARLVPPTSQNQARIEADLRTSLQDIGLDQADEVLRLHAETVVRNYDPCISCSTHFLDLRVRRD